jgi:hypothetical protein
VVEKLTLDLYIRSLATALVDIPAVSMPPQNLRSSVALCWVTKLQILEWPFIIPSTKCICVMIMLFNQLLDMPHLSGGWTILANDKMLTNLCTSFEKYTFCADGKFWDLLFHLYYVLCIWLNTHHTFCIWAGRGQVMSVSIWFCIKKITKLKSSRFLKLLTSVGQCWSHFFKTLHSLHYQHAFQPNS